MASARFPEDWLAACGPENNGAGGRGRFGLRPCLEDGDPGRGLPLRSAGSYAMSGGGGRDDSEEVRDKRDRVGEPLAGMYGRYDGASVDVGASFGAVSSMDGDWGRGREDVEDDGWYVLWGEAGLKVPGGELCFLKWKRTVVRRLGDSGILPT